MTDKGGSVSPRSWTPIVGLVLTVAAVVALLNDVPQFVDETLPWFGERLRVGPIDSTAWDVAWATVAIIAGLVSSSLAVSLSRRVDALQEASRHRLLEVRLDVSHCACGWWGLHGDFERHPEVPGTDMRQELEAKANGEGREEG